MSDEPEAPTPEQAKARKRELNRPTWAVVLGVLGVFPLALYLGIRALMDRKRAIEEGRGYEGWGTASAVTGIILGLVTLASVGVFVVSGIGGGDGSGTPAAASSASGQPDAGGNGGAQPVDRPYAVGDEFRDGNYKFTVVSAKQVSSIEGYTPVAGGAFVRVVVDAENQSANPALAPFCAPNYNGIVLIDDQDRNYSVDAASADLSTAIDAYCTSPVQPGLARRFVLAFQIPKAAVAKINGLGVWDPTESGDPTGDTYYVVEARP